MTRRIFRGTTATFRFTALDEDEEVMTSLDQATLYLRQGSTRDEFDLEFVDGKWVYRADTGNYNSGLLHWSAYFRSGAVDDPDRVEITKSSVIQLDRTSPPV